jgi:ssRNA-specific RNase YbeY (16S rRNA maturation enzyme)
MFTSTFARRSLSSTAATSTAHGSTVFFRCRKSYLPILDLKLLHKQTTAIKRLAGYHDWDLQVNFVSNAYIHDLNKRYRKQDKPTDILSFPTYPVQLTSTFRLHVAHSG